MIGRPFSLLAVGLLIYITCSIMMHPGPWGSNPIKMKAFSWISEKLSIMGNIGADCGLWNKVDAIRKQNSVFATRQQKVHQERTTIDGVGVIIFYSGERTGNDDPGVIYYHGGGWMLCDAETFGTTLARYAEGLGAVVVSVEYPLLPEASMSELLDACFRVTKYFIEHSKKWGVDANKIIITGESAGAHIAASTNIRLRDAKIEPMPRLQVLVNGLYQILDVGLPSYIQNSNGPVVFKSSLDFVYSTALTREIDKYTHIFRENKQVPVHIRKQLENSISAEFIPIEQRYPPYVSKPHVEDAETVAFWKNFGDTLMDPYITPLLAPSHSNLSEALIISAQYDMIRDESFLYARKLRMSGTPVTHRNNPVGIHVVSELHEMFEDGEFELSYIIDFIKSRLE